MRPYWKGYLKLALVSIMPQCVATPPPAHGRNRRHGLSVA
jgi:hypothetical protein